jgi:hypothetical protein
MYCIVFIRRCSDIAILKNCNLVTLSFVEKDPLDHFLQMVFVVGLQEGAEAGLAQEQDTFGDLLQVNLPGTYINRVLNGQSRKFLATNRT